MADTLDALNPLLRKPRPERPAVPSPQGIAIAEIHNLNARLSQGEITAEEFDRHRKPHLDLLSSLHEEKTAPKRQPPPIFDAYLNTESSEHQIAAALHAQHRYLASLPEREAAEIRADKDSPMNRLYRILDQQAQPHDSTKP